MLNLSVEKNGCLGFFVHVEPLVNVDRLLRFKAAMLNDPDIRAKYIALKKEALSLSPVASSSPTRWQRPSLSFVWLSQ